MPHSIFPDELVPLHLLVFAIRFGRQANLLLSAYTLHCDILKDCQNFS